MTTLLQPTRSEQHVAHAREELDDRAISCARADAEHCLDLDVGVPTMGMTTVLAWGRQMLDELRSVQRVERSVTVLEVDAANARADTFATWKEGDPIPDGTPTRSMATVRGMQAVGVALLVGETILLVPRFNEILRAGTGATVEGVTGAAFVTVVGAILAHIRGDAITRANDSRDPDLVSAANTQANGATLGLIIAGIAAVSARIYAGAIADGGIDTTGVGFFVFLQLVILSAALALPTAITSARRAIERGRIADGLEAARTARKAATDRLEQFDTIHPQQPGQIDDATVAALETYLGTLADHMQPTYMADPIRTYLATAHLDGSLRRLVADGPIPGPAAEPEEDGGDEGPPEAPPTGPTGPQPPPPESATGRYSPQDLIDDIHGRRAG